nr:hypothetical protein CFP56_64813 [Quercus suber]
MSRHGRPMDRHPISLREPDPSTPEVGGPPLTVAAQGRTRPGEMLELDCSGAVPASRCPDSDTTPHSCHSAPSRCGQSSRRHPFIIGRRRECVPRLTLVSALRFNLGRNKSGVTSKTLLASSG